MEIEADPGTSSRAGGSGNMRTMSSESRRARGGRGAARGLRLAIAIGVAAGGWFAAARPAAAAPVMSRNQQVDSSDDWTLHMAIGLDLGAGGTITDFNVLPGPDGTLFFTAVRSTYDLKHGFAGMLTLRQWWLPGPNHALVIGFGTRFEPFVYTWGRIFFDAALGPVSTSNAWTFGYDLGAGLEFELPDVPGFSIGPYVRYGQVINPDKRDTQDGLAWTAGASITYHFGRAALAPKTSSGPEVKHGAWHVSIPDTDKDGIPDDEDQCKDAPAGAHPDPFRPGCPENDEDGDGVPDVDDACPVTPPGPKPDPKRPGCPFLDADGDGVSDADDACPTKAGVASTDPSKNGCPDGHKKAAPAAPPPSAPEDETPPKPVKKRHHLKPATDTGGERIN
jgi:hypothetical protein